MVTDSPPLPPRAVVLLSGGLDSAVSLAIARERGFRCLAVSFRYGQRHAAELRAAERVARALGADRHVVTSVDLRSIGGSALTADIPVPKDRAMADVGTGIPVTYVPGRNTVFLSLGLAWAEVYGAGDIFVGMNVLDYSGYPDCRPAYLRAFEAMANLATKAAVEDGRRICIQAPLIELTKREIIARGLSLGVDFGLTLSCYDPDEDGCACGHCDACRLRLRGFAENSVADPATYRTGVEDVPSP